MWPVAGSGARPAPRRRSKSPSPADSLRARLVQLRRVAASAQPPASADALRREIQKLETELGQTVESGPGAARVTRGSSEPCGPGAWIVRKQGGAWVETVEIDPRRGLRVRRGALTYAIVQEPGTSWDGPYVEHAAAARVLDLEALAGAPKAGNVNHRHEHASADPDHPPRRE